MARDKRRFGPLPKEWAHYKGIYQNGDQEIIRYSVGNSDVLEMFGMEMMQNNPVFTRILNLTKSTNPLKMRVAPKGTSVAIKGTGARLGARRPTCRAVEKESETARPLPRRRSGHAPTRRPGRLW